jgi:hypothetical protein
LNAIEIAAVAIKADVVCVSFSFSYPSREVVPMLRRLRRLLPANVQLWAGGGDIPVFRKSIKGVVAYSNASGHAFQYEAGRGFRFDPGHHSDLKPAT